MKSTEIEAERVVSTSGLLTGRPNASWPRRISASPPKTNFFSPPPPLHPDIWKTRQSPLLSHNTSTLNTHLKICGVLTVYNAAPTQMHATRAHAHPLRRRRARFSAEQGLGPRGRRLSPNPDAPFGLGGIGFSRNYQRARSARACGSLSHSGVCPKDSQPQEEKTRRCLVYRPLPLSNYKTN